MADDANHCTIEEANMTIAHNLGFPRIGHQRELKKALEAYWIGAASAESLLETGRHLRAKHQRSPCKSRRRPHWPLNITARAFNKPPPPPA